MLVMRVSKHLFNYLLYKKLIFPLTGPHRPDGLFKAGVPKPASHVPHVAHCSWGKCFKQKCSTTYI